MEGLTMGRLIIIALILVAAMLPSRPAGAQDTCFTLPASYRSDDLRLAAVLMKPAGIGPFPAVVFNHSSKSGRERQPTVEDGTPCFAVVSEQGWVYFAPDRRGYGRSEGPTLARAIGNRSGLLLLLAVRTRSRQEAGDIIAGVEFLRRRPFVDDSRIAAVGNSLGGLYTYLAASTRPDAFRAIVLQGIDAGPYSELLLREMIRGAGSITASILIQQTRDGDQAPVKFAHDLTDALRRAGKDVTLRLYPGTHDLFTPESRGPDGAWGKDLVEFLDRQFAKPL
jgi:carboxymethylenebutenolidase